MQQVVSVCVCVLSSDVFVPGFVVPFGALRLSGAASTLSLKEGECGFNFELKSSSCSSRC